MSASHTMPLTFLGRTVRVSALGRAKRRTIHGYGVGNHTRKLSSTLAEETSRGKSDEAEHMNTHRIDTSQAENLTEIGTRAIFNTDHDLFRHTCRKFFETQVAPHHGQWEQDGIVPRKIWEKAGEWGLLGVNTPAKYGGIGADILSAAIVWEEQSYANTQGPSFSVHSDIVMPYLVKYASQSIKEKYLAQMTLGRCIGAIAMTEPGTGSDLQGVRTNAVKSACGKFYTLTGEKTFITGGILADIVIVLAKTIEAKENTNAQNDGYTQTTENRQKGKQQTGAHTLSLFVVEKDMKGFTRGRKLSKMGLKAQDTAELYFDEVQVPAENLLGKENEGFYYCMKELPQERLLIADMAVASTEAAYEWTREYVKDRKAFGKTLSALQTVRHSLAEVKSEAVVGRAFVDRCLQLHSQCRLDATTASMAKYWATEMQGRCIDKCLQLHGGAGYMSDMKINRAFADARVQRIYGGANEIMKELIARSI